MKFVSVFIFLLVFALPVSAQTETRLDITSQETETSASGYVKVDGIDGESSESSKGNVETEWKVEEGESAATPGVEPDEIDVRATSETRNTEKESGEKGGTADINIGVGELNIVSVSAVEVRGWDPEKKEAFLGTVQTHAQVRSEQDLENFATGVLVNDTNFETIALNYDKIDVKYRMEGKLFGFLPHTYTERVTVQTSAEAQERVQVRFPWYRFLLATGITETEIEESLEADLDLGAQTETDVRTLAQALETISISLKAKHETAMNSIRNLK